MPRPKKENKRLVMSFTVEPDLYEKIKDLSKERNITPSSLVADLVKGAIEGNKDKKEICKEGILKILETLEEIKEYVRKNEIKDK